MPRKKTESKSVPVTAIRHTEKRANIPTDELSDFVAEDEKHPKTMLYPRDPSLDPQLVWKGKDEQDSKDLAVPAVPVYIQEKIHPQAIIENVRFEAKKGTPQQASLFADFNGIAFEELIEFYRHEQNWSNRMILGDSLLVMTSLAEKERLKGQVQMIYIDPPYGIKFGSNWQVSTRKRDVKDGKAEDATRQPEQIKAFRDTWELGIHSYLAYMRDRLVAARELLVDSGSIFVQIGEENVHLVRCLLDEIFGSENFVSQIVYRTKNMTFGAKYLETIADFILWYAKDKDRLKYRQLFREMITEGDSHWNLMEFEDGHRETMSSEQIENHKLLPTNTIDICQLGSLYPAGVNNSGLFNFSFHGKTYSPPIGKSWKTNETGLDRAIVSNRIEPYQEGKTVRYVMKVKDYPISTLPSLWHDTPPPSDKEYVVQTSTRIIERCVLMSTDPGDLVLDPTCVRKGTGVYSPSPALPVHGEGDGDPPRAGGERGGIPPAYVQGGEKFRILPVETLRPGDFVCGHDGEKYSVLRVIEKPYKGQMIGIRHAQSEKTLWLTADHRVLCKPRPRTLGGNSDWSGSPISHLERRRELRRNATPPERALWSILRNNQASVKFRRQHPIGPYIADFYSRDASLVVEVDGETHFQPDASAYDAERDEYMRGIGLNVLRFTAHDVAKNLPGIALAIENQVQLRCENPENAEWMQAGCLEINDIVFYGPERKPVRITSIERMQTEEIVYDLEIDDAHSFLTEVCAVHNCGSGTTAYVAEQWGRRWITIDTSRVAIALARTRLMAARYPYFLLADTPDGARMDAESAGHLPVNGQLPTASGQANINRGFVYKRVPHVTLKSIANNEEIDTIHAKWQEQLELIRNKINKLLKENWEEWEIPRELPSPINGGRDGEGGQRNKLLAEWWKLRRERQREIDASIAKRADTELLYDQPYEDNKRIRVAGPFTVESLSPHRVLAAEEERPATEAAGQAETAQGFVQMIIDNLKAAGVQNTIKKERLNFDRLEPFAGEWLHATGEYSEAGKTKRVAVSVGPEHGTVGKDQIKEAAKEAVKGVGFDLLIVCGFAFDPLVNEEAKRYGNLTVLITHMNPDLSMGDELLKKTGAANLFMVFGEPDIEIKKQKDGRLVLSIRGVDVYDPTTGEIRSHSTDEIACWFIDTDYNGESFFVRHAYFTGADQPYEKLKRALRAEVDEAAWSALYSTKSLPFDPPAKGKIAVKVINHYGDEVMKVYPNLDKLT